MKAISPALLAFLNASRVNDFPVAKADLFTLSFVNGGVTYFTSYDVSITWGGHFFQAQSILIAGLKFKVSTGLEVDRQQITMTAAEGSNIGGNPWFNALREGVFDGAGFQRDVVFMDESLPGGIDGFTVFKGRVSTVDKAGRTKAQLTIASPLVVLDYYMPRNIFSPTCLHVLYDAGCGLNPALFQLVATVGAGSTQVTINNSAASQNQVQGSIIFTSGLNAGLRATVKSAIDGVSWTLMYPLPSMPATGDGFLIFFGCDHTAGTCKSKFNNIVNFRGFPNVPPPDYAV